MNENLSLGILMVCTFLLGVLICAYPTLEKKPLPLEENSPLVEKTPAVIHNTDDDYYIFKGFIPSNVGDEEKRSFKWDHAPKLQKEGVQAFIWCDGVWGSIVLDDFKIENDVTFIRAPACTTYIKKSKDNEFLDSVDRSFELLGFEKTPKA
jgi:hypothetical protein